MDFEHSFSFTEKAAEDLEQIMEYISVSLANPSAAKSFNADMEEVISRMLLFPDAGAPVNNPLVSIPNVRKIFIKNYTLYYVQEHEGENLIILRIVYSRRNTDEIISKFSS